MEPSTLKYNTATALSRFNEDHLLIRITSSLPGGRRQSKVAAQDAASANNAEVNSVSASVVLFTNEAIKPARDCVRLATQVLKDKTVPWNNDGWRIIPTQVYQELYPNLKNQRANFYDERDEFVATYNEKISDAKRRLDFLFNIDDFPSAQDVGESFAFEIETDAIKDARDIRIKGSVELVQQVEQEILQRNKKKLEEAQQDVVNRLLKQVKSFTESVSNYHDKVDKGRRSAFYDSAITGINALCAALPKLNITNDDEIKRLGKLVQRELGDLNPEKIKTDPAARTAAIKKGSTLFDKIQGIALNPIN